MHTQMVSTSSVRFYHPRLACVLLLLVFAVESFAFVPAPIGSNLLPRPRIPQSSCRNPHQALVRTARVVPSAPLHAMEENAAGRAAAHMASSGRVPAFIYTANSASKWVVTLAHTLAVWSRPWTYTAPYIVVGSIGAVYLTEVLKRIINQGRPEGAPFTDPGMPSSHSLVSFFAAAAWTSVLDFGGMESARALIVGAAAIIAALRVVCGYHTIAQVAVGAGVGSALGRGWAILGEAMRTGADPRLVSALAWGSYLGGSAFFIRKNMRHWVGRDKHI